MYLLRLVVIGAWKTRPYIHECTGDSTLEVHHRFQLPMSAPRGLEERCPKTASFEGDPVYAACMELDPHACYRALLSRDPRFDGRFFAGVRTTGIYCRSICPAPKPKEHNVRFFACAAAAEEAGFRPCFRCRPEASPGTPAWMGTSTTVSRALRLIGEGYLDACGVENLAEQLGITDRHLRRLFIEHLGASPLAIAQARRVHAAKLLLDNTPLSVTDVALSSGFSSIRRFNDAFRKTYRRSPTAARRASSRVSEAADGDVALRLPYRPPYDWRAIIEFLIPRAIPGVEQINDEVYRRVVVIEDEVGVVTVSHPVDSHHLTVLIPANLSKNVSRIAACVRRLFDLQADPSEIDKALASDRMLRAAVRRYPGQRVPGAWDPFETSIRAILGQQVSVKGATTIAGRIVQRYGRRIESPFAGADYVFPKPARLRHARFNNIGLPGGRIRALRSFARAYDIGLLTFDGSQALDDFIATMTSLEGIGPWTAHYVAMRAAGEPDAFPATDLALRRVAQAADPALRNEQRLIERSAAWSPWRAYAAMYLWRLYTDNPEKGGKK